MGIALNYATLKLIQPDIVLSTGKMTAEKPKPKCRAPGQATINKILTALKGRGSISTAELMNRTSLVECTVYRACRVMQTNGLIIRSHAKAKCGNNRTFFCLS